LPLVARKMAPMRDLIRGGSTVDVCGIGEFPPVQSGLCGRCRRPLITVDGQCGMSAQPYQPEKPTKALRF
jgi:hypothetical protein